MHLFNEGSSERSFDFTVAGVHFDNALELYLKSYAMTFNISGWDKANLPTLMNSLNRFLPELNKFGEELGKFHKWRNLAYHLGESLDERQAEFGFAIINSFFGEVQRREKMPKEGF